MDFFSTSLLFAQLVATGGITGWMLTGLWDNLRHPSQNETITAEVMEMRRLRDGYPDAFLPVAHRAITDRRKQLRAFRVVVLIEAIASITLLIGVGALALALLGLIGSETARACALIGASSFLAVWMGMLIVGNHFCYWFGHEGAQLTHYQMCLWGLGTTILLALPT